MGWWVTILAMAAVAWPMAASAAPQGGAPGPADWSPTPSYKVTAPADLGGASGEGWGLHAALAGRSLDLRHPGLGWGDERALGPHDSAAGYGWTHGGATAMFGYTEIDYGARAASRTTDFNHAQHDMRRGVMGLSFVFRR